MNLNALLGLIGLILNLSFVLNKELTATEQEQKLIQKLLKGYNKKQKPFGNLEVKFALNLNSIVDVKARDQIFMLNVFLDHSWFDRRLSWDPELNYNLTNIKIASENLWTPDTFIYTTADKTGFLLPQKGAYFVVSHDGDIFWPNPLPQMKVRCGMSIKWFPFDEQICTIVFGSWSNTQMYLNYTLMNEESNLADYQENSEWTLLNYKGFRHEILYDNWIENDAFSEIHYKILIRRKPLFVLQNYALPAVILCIITLSTFYMPFAQEMQLGIAIMLTFSILKLRLSDDIPAQSDTIPLFNVYFTACMCSALVSLFWFYQMHIMVGKKRMPKWLRCFTLKVVCKFLRLPDHYISKDKKTSAERKNESKEPIERVEYTDSQLIPIFNDFVYLIFVLYFFLLNVFLLGLFPKYFKPALTLSS